MYNLCILTSHFYPVKSSCSSLFKDLIKSLLHENYKITVLSISGTKNEVRQIKTKKLSYISVKNPYLQSNKNYFRAIGDIVAITKLTNYYKPNFESGINLLDESLKIKWPKKNCQISKKDKNLQSFKDFRKIHKFL